MLLGGDEGFVVVEEGLQVAAAGYNTSAGFFYGHSLASVGDAGAVAMITQALRKRARDLGFDTIRFGVDPNQPSLMRWAESGLATVRQIVLEIRS